LLFSNSTLQLILLTSLLIQHRPLLIYGNYKYTNAYQGYFTKNIILSLSFIYTLFLIFVKCKITHLGQREYFLLSSLIQTGQYPFQLNILIHANNLYRYFLVIMKKNYWKLLQKVTAGTHQPKLVN
jgi:hypothetical protein